MSGWLLPIVAVLLIGYGAVSARLQTSVVTEAMVFVVAGLLLGSWALDVIDVGPANTVVLLLAEVTLAVVLFTDAVRVKLPRLRHEAAVPVRLLGIGLPLTIVAGTLVGLLVFPDLNVWTAAALATILAPTDAALGLPRSLLTVGPCERRHPKRFEEREAIRISRSFSKGRENQRHSWRVARQRDGPQRLGQIPRSTSG